MSRSLTLAQSAALLSGHNTWQTRSFPEAGVRSLFLADGPHGIRKQTGSGDHLGIAASEPATCFPTAATVANSWDPALAEEIGRALGAEAAERGIDVLLGPGLNIKRSPLCGRNFEYFSEDPYLSGKLAAGYVRGIQSRGVAACPKHFAANSQELRRMASNSVVDERTLREIYLTAFEIVVREAGPRALMSAYNRVNGDYAHENAHLLRDILRDEWGFDGAVITDWGGGNDPVKAIPAGGGLEMPSPGFDSALRIMAAVDSGELARTDLDARVAEIRDLIDWIDGTDHHDDHDDHDDLARRAAQESIVLLKNDDAMLPLPPGTRVAVIGDFADRPRYQGAGSSLVNPTRIVTARDALAGTGLDIVGYAPGFRRLGAADPRLAREAVELATRADCVLYFMGLDEVSESEGKDRDHLRLNDNQVALLEQLAQLSTRIVVVLAAGSVVEMPWLDRAAALVHGYLHGQAGASAIADVLTGAVNPSGRLAESYPVRLEDTATAGSFPAPGERAEYREGLFVGYRYYATAQVPVRFPFGFGLSYTTFEYEDLSVNAAGATFSIANRGPAPGADVAQLYIRRRTPGAVRPKVELKGFSKVRLAPGERVRVTIPFDRYTFRYFDGDAMRWTVETGDYDIVVGSSAADERLRATFSVVGDGRGRVPEGMSWYAAAEVGAVTDVDFAQLLGRPVPRAEPAPTLQINDPLRAMHRARSPLARVVARVLAALITRSERRGRPDLNLYFLYNMPFRALVKMTNGSVSLPMLEAIVTIVNGSLLRGTGRLVRQWVNTRSRVARLRAELARDAHATELEEIECDR